MRFRMISDKSYCCWCLHNDTNDFADNGVDDDYELNDDGNAKEK